MSFVLNCYDLFCSYVYVLSSISDVYFIFSILEYMVAFVTPHHIVVVYNYPYYFVIMV